MLIVVPVVAAIPRPVRQRLGRAPGRVCLALAGSALLSLSAGCHAVQNALSGPSGQGNGGTATFVDEGVRFSGVHPAPIVANGIVFVYQNTGTDGTSVEASSDGLSFSLTAAAFPAGISRTIVALPDGRFRMYYFADSTSADVISAISSDGLHWTVEGGVRYSNPGIGAIRATVLPTGGVRLYFPVGNGLASAISNDGLTFCDEGLVAVTMPDGTSTIGPSTVAFLSGQFHMVLTRMPASGIADLWHATSSDGRIWTVDKTVLAANPGVPLNQPAWGVNGGTLRIYYRAVPTGGTSVIGSGLVKF